VTFDEPNLVSCAGLLPLLRLAERAGLHEVADRRVRLPEAAGSAAANPAAKITSIIAGMVTGADSIEDLDVILWVPVTRPQALTWSDVSRWGSARCTS
jgi:hypothetical protein